MEGLPDEDPVMASFDKHHAFQCGSASPAWSSRLGTWSARAARATGKQSRRSRRQPVPLRPLHEDHRRRRGGSAVKYVTYERRTVPGSAARGDDGGRRRVRRRHGRLHRGRRAARRPSGRSRRAAARAAAPPLPARLPRLRGAPQERLSGASAARSRPSGTRCPAYYKGLPDTVIGPDAEIPWPSLHRQARPRAGARRRHRHARARRQRRRRLPPRLRLHDLERHVRPRRPDARAAVGMGPGKAKDWDGSNVLGPCIVTADEIDIDRPSSSSVRVNGERWGGDRTAAHAPLLRATSSPTPRRT